MAFLNKDIQASGTIAAAKKAHDNAEKEYKATLNTVEKALREAEKALRLGERSLNPRDNLVIFDTFNAKTTDLRRATNTLKGIMVDFNTMLNRNQIQDWATRHHQVLKVNGGALSLSQVKKTAQALDREVAANMKVIAESNYDIVKSVAPKFESEGKLNAYVNDKALRTLAKRASHPATNSRSLKSFGANAKKAFSSVSGDVLITYAGEKFGDRTITRDITVVWVIENFLLPIPDAQFGAVIYALWKSGAINTLDLNHVFHSNQSAEMFNKQLWNILMDAFQAPPEYFFHSGSEPDIPELNGIMGGIY